MVDSESRSVGVGREVAAGVVDELRGREQHRRREKCGAGVLGGRAHVRCADLWSQDDHRSTQRRETPRPRARASATHRLPLADPAAPGRALSEVVVAGLWCAQPPNTRSAPERRARGEFSGQRTENSPRAAQAVSPAACCSTRAEISTSSMDISAHVDAGPPAVSPGAPTLRWGTISGPQARSSAAAAATSAALSGAGSPPGRTSASSSPARMPRPRRTACSSTGQVAGP